MQPDPTKPAQAQCFRRGSSNRSRCAGAGWSCRAFGPIRVVRRAVLPDRVAVDNRHFRRLSYARLARSSTNRRSAGLMLVSLRRLWIVSQSHEAAAVCRDGNARVDRPPAAVLVDDAPGVPLVFLVQLPSLGIDKGRGPSDLSEQGAHRVDGWAALPSSGPTHPLGAGTRRPGRTRRGRASRYGCALRRPRRARRPARARRRRPRN
jgi:hypothetical protein